MFTKLFSKIIVTMLVVIGMISIQAINATSAHACSCSASRVDPVAIKVYQSGQTDSYKEAMDEEKYQIRKRAGMEQDDHTEGSSGNSNLSGNPRSSKDLENREGETKTRRYYDNTGKADEDIDYTNHGYPKTHSKVPHRHKWDWSKGYPERGDQF